MTANRLTRRSFAGLMTMGAASACVPRIPASNPNLIPPGPLGPGTPVEGNGNHLSGYGPLFDAGYTLPQVPEQFTQGVNRRVTGVYVGEQGPGTIDVDPFAKFLYWVPFDGPAIRYPVGIGRAGRSFAGNGVIRLKRQWPGWTPTPNMIRREPDVYGPFRRGIPGGLRSPLGSRALYLYRGGRDTFYRIHGTNDLNSIGNSGSAGCIRMFNQDIIDLYDRVPLETRVHVRGEAESLRVDPENYNRGIELPPVILDPEDVYGEAALARDRPPDFDAVNPSLPTIAGGDLL